MEHGPDLRTRIVAAAARLIAERGRDAATTRAVAQAAGVQAPTIYRLFGDKRGLLDAVAAHGAALYVADKASQPPHPDPVQDLRDGWDMHVAFGLAHPDLFAILSSDAGSAAAAKGLEVLRRRVKAVARAGRLRVGEARAAALIHAAGVGTVLTLLAEPEERRDAGLAGAAREAVMAAILHEAPSSAAPGAAAAASTLAARMDDIAVLSAGERALLRELLGRIADAG